VFRKLVCLVFVGITAVGCASKGEGFESKNASFSGRPDTQQDFATLVYQAAQTLSERAVYLDKTRPIIVATVVSVDNLEDSSTFGRLTSQMVANRIAQRGYLVRDVTYMRGVALQPSGELVLTREASKVSAEVKAQAVIAGTYAVAGKEIYLNLRMLNASSGEILSTADVVIPLNNNTIVLVTHVFSPQNQFRYDQFEELARKGQIIK